VVQPATQDQQRHKRRGHQGQAQVIEPEDPQQEDHEGPIHQRGQRGAADGLADFDRVVEPGQDFPNAARLEERQRQPQNVTRIAGQQSQIHLAAHMGQQILAEGAEERPEHHDQYHADAQGVEEARRIADQDRVHQVLHKVGGGHAEQGHEQGTEEGLP
jgi:hypothetical protein